MYFFGHQSSNTLYLQGGRASLLSYPVVFLYHRRVLESANDGLFDVRSIGVHTSVNARLRVERLIGTDSRTIPVSSSNKRTSFTDKTTLFANTYTTFGTYIPSTENVREIYQICMVK